MEAMHEQESDGELLARTRAGDGEAFGVLFERRRQVVFAFLLRQTGDSEAAMDLMAETFASALLALRSRPPRIDSSALPWLLTIARNGLIDGYRRGRVEDAARRRLAFQPAEIADDDVQAALRETGDFDLLALLERELSPVEFQALRARVLDERDYEDIARELSCSAAVVRKRVSRAISSLRERPGGLP